MTDPAARQPRKSNGSLGQSSDLHARIGAGPVEDIAALTPAPRDAGLRQQLDRLTQGLAQSLERSDRLEAAFGTRTRRVQQLIGERDRLISLLAARDAELRRLNRELGALNARAAPVAAGSPALLAAARAMLEKIRPARKAPARSGPARTPTAIERVPTATTERAPAAPALVPWLGNGPPKAVLGVVVFGLSEAEIASVLDVVEPYCAEHELAPLLLTDNDALQLFRGRRVLFEFLPARSDRERLAPELDWRLFTLRRLALIRRKWQPVRVVAFGRAAAEVVEQWLESPFEVSAVPALLKARPEGAGPDWSAVRQPEAIHP